MNTDKKVLYSISSATLAVLLLALILPLGTTGRVLAAIIMIPIAAVAYLFIKKRSILSINKGQILMIITAIALVYLMVCYLSGLAFGFYKNPYKFNLNTIFNFILPITVIIVTTEILRYVMIAQDDRTASILTYISCVAAEVLTCSTISGITSFGKFMDVVAMTFFPAVIANLLYHYLSKRYGIYPNLTYRLITALYAYIIPYLPAISDAIISFVNLLLPIAIYLFIDSLYERKRRFALAKKSKLAVPITILAVAIMLFTVMVVSNQFYIGAYVIATESMTGELNRGDAAIYERYEDQTVTEGQVIAFEKNDIVVVHRVVDIQIINGRNRYFTKGDANDSNDAGFIYDSDIIGLVNLKIPYIGYPTLWLRSLFRR